MSDYGDKLARDLKKAEAAVKAAQGPYEKAKEKYEKALSDLSLAQAMIAQHEEGNRESKKRWKVHVGFINTMGYFARVAELHPSDLDPIATLEQAARASIRNLTPAEWHSEIASKGQPALLVKDKSNLNEHVYLVSPPYDGRGKLR